MCIHKIIYLLQVGGLQDAYLTLVERILVGPCGLRAPEVDSLLGQENLRVHLYHERD